MSKAEKAAKTAKAAKNQVDASFFGTESVWKVLLRIAPPVMFAQLVQALYNIVDSYFVGMDSAAGLTALSVAFPLQWIIQAIAIGTGVGVNTLMSRFYAQENKKAADETAGVGTVLALVSWAVFAVLSLLLLRPYVSVSVSTAAAAKEAMTYGTIVCVGSLGIFLESIWTKVHQAGGNMKTPMIAQVCGALTNIVLDPLLIFGWGPVKPMGIAGAAIATVLGQFVAAGITLRGGLKKAPEKGAFKTYAARIYRLGYPSILMQMLYTVYVSALNIILATFCDEAVTVLGLYYKVQTFFFLPLLALETCIVPVLSYNCTRGDYGRCKSIMNTSILISAVFMLLGIACFELIPKELLAVFSREEKVYEIGQTAFRIIGTSFIPAVVSLMLPVFFQAIGKGKESVFLSLMRQVICLIPIFWLCSRFGLAYAWLAFPISECITDAVGLTMYARQWKRFAAAPEKTA